MNYDPDHMLKNTFLIVILCLSATYLKAQNLTSKELIEVWKTNDVTQTIKAEETYNDLLIHTDKEKFDRLMSELNAYIQDNSNRHLAIRVKMYGFIGSNLFEKATPDKKEPLKELMKEALLINDRHILSELYSIYAEKGPGKVEDKLFYNNQAVEIQKMIGFEYFPRAYTRYYNLSQSYYMLEEYEKSLEMGMQSLDLLGKATNNLAVYCLQSDIVALSHYELNNIDSGIYYNKKIKEAIRHYDPDDPGNYMILRAYNSSYVPIWEGVSDGGIARGYLMKGQYDEAISLLVSNIEYATKYNQKNDVAKAKNLLGEAYWGKEDRKSAVKAWNEAFLLASEINHSREQLNAAAQLIDAYKVFGKYDSASVFYDHYLRLYEQHQANLNDSKLTIVNTRLEHENLRNIVQEAEQLISKQQFTRNIIITIFVALFFIAGLLYNRYRLKHNLRLAQSEQQLHLFKEKLIQNNRIIEKLVKEEKTTPVSLAQLSEKNILTDDDWKKFQHEFHTVYPLFIDHLHQKHPSLTQGEIRYICLVKLGLSNKEIASALGISPASVRVTWYRLRQKLKPEHALSPADLIKTLDTSSLA